MSARSACSRGPHRRVGQSGQSGAPRRLEYRLCPACLDRFESAAENCFERGRSPAQFALRLCGVGDRIPQHEIELAAGQQWRAAGYPRERNPGGRRPMTIDMLEGRHRQWVDRLGSLRTCDGAGFDAAKIVPYAYRHTYAQRHADAGVPIDVLAELQYLITGT